MPDNICLIFDYDEDININYRTLTFKKTNTVREVIEKFLRVNNLKMDYSTEYIMFINWGTIINSDKYLDKPLERVNSSFLHLKNAKIYVHLTNRMVGG